MTNQADPSEITLTLRLSLAGLPARTFLRLATRGLVSTTNAGEELLGALESAAEQRGTVGLPLRRPHLSREAVTLALQDAGGRLAGAARALGCARSTLRAAMVRHGLVATEQDAATWIAERATGGKRSAGTGRTG